MKRIGIVMGSDSDLPVVKKATDVLKEFGVPFEAHVFSAHRTPEQARDFALHARENGFGAIIAAAVLVVAVTIIALVVAGPGSSKKKSAKKC